MIESIMEGDEGLTEKIIKNWFYFQGETGIERYR